MGLSFLKSKVAPVSLPEVVVANAGILTVEMHRLVISLPLPWLLFTFIDVEFNLMFHLSAIQHGESILQLFAWSFTSNCFSHSESSARSPNVSAEEASPSTCSFGSLQTTSLRCEKWPFIPIFNKSLVPGRLLPFPSTSLGIEMSEEKSYWKVGGNPQPLHSLAHSYPYCQWILQRLLSNWWAW